MPSVLNLALSGLTKAVTQAANVSSNIVNASSTGSIDTSLVSLVQAKADYGANVDVIKAAEKTQKSLLDIKV